MKQLSFVLVVAMALLAAPFVLRAQSTQPATRPAPVEDLLNQMLRPPSAAAKPLEPIGDAARDKPANVRALTPNPPAVKLVREGTFIVDRVGRLSKSADGKGTEFVFESDGQTLRDPPLPLLPNLKLEAMEAASAGRDARFRVTGMLTEYRGRNYLLLEKVVPMPAE